MRIALIGPSYPFRGGIAHYTTLLYRHLKLRHKVRFLSLRRQYPRWLYPGASDRDPSEFAIREDGTENVLDPTNPWTWWQVAQRATAFRPDLIILPWWVSFWSPSYTFILSILRRRTRAKVLYLCHNVTPHESRRYDRWLARLPLSLGDLFVVHSRQDEERLRRLLPGARIQRTVHPTYEVFRRVEISKAEARQQLGAIGDTLLFFGFVRPYKGLEHLLEAMPIVLAERDLHLWVVGEFWQNEARYRQQIKSLGVEDQVHVVNRYISNEEIGIYFAAADAVILPYISGTGSGIAQIAFGYERPIVATRVGDLPDIVEDGQTGWLVPPADPPALAAAMLRIYEHDGDRWAAQIRARRDRFTWERMVECIEQLAAGAAA